MTIAAYDQPPCILQIYREGLQPGAEAAYGAIEEEITRLCLELGCPHPYLGLESMTGPKEVWYFNGYVSAEDRQRVADEYRRNEPLLAALTEASARKSALTLPAVEVFAAYRPDLSRGEPWLLGRGRFLVIAATSGRRPSTGAVFEAGEGTRFVVQAAVTREGADALAEAIESESRIFAVRPTWSTPARSWIDADPLFWEVYPPVVAE